MQRLIHGRIYYGWILVPIGCLCYGLGIAPAYGSWGFFAPELREELGLSRADIGSVFGLFSLFLLAVAPLTGVLINRVGLRVTITAGALMAATGMWMLSKATSLVDCYIAYSGVVGVGLAFSTAFPMQTLATFWFKKYRATALAIILSGSMGLGTVIALINDYLLHHGGWRFAWQVYTCVSLFVAIVAATFIRDSPEKYGLCPDGIDDSLAPAEPVKAVKPVAGSRWHALRITIFTPQFLLISLAALGQLGPWTVFTAHGRLHLDVLMTSTVAAWLLSTKNFASTLGRLMGAAGDLVAPRRLLTLTLLLEGAGFAGLAVTENYVLSFLSAVLFGAGYGASMLLIGLTFAEVFGRALFVTTAGASRMLQGLFNFIVPIACGAMADRLGSYTTPFLYLSALAIVGGVGVCFCQPRPQLIAEPEATAPPGTALSTAPHGAKQSI